MCFSFFFRELIGQKKKKGGRGKKKKGPPPPPPPIVFSFDPGSVFERHPLLYESQTNNTQSPPMPVTQSKNINSDIRF